MEKIALSLEEVVSQAVKYCSVLAEPDCWPPKKFVVIKGDKDRFKLIKEQIQSRGINVRHFDELDGAERENRASYYEIDLNVVVVKEPIISPIEKGVVIDHVPNGLVYYIADVLKIPKRKGGRVSIGDGLDSKKLGKKGIIKIENIELGDYDFGLVSLFAPGATVNFIQNWNIVEKRRVDLPEILYGVLVCPNKTCVTNMEKGAPKTRFYHSKRDNCIMFSCDYCERYFSKEELISHSFGINIFPQLI